MNTQVTATGMEVTAKSDAIFLQIKGTEDNDFATTGTNALDETLYPVHHEAWSGVATIEDFDIAVADTYDNWYYRYSDDPTVYNSNMTDKAYISSFTDYVATCTYDVKLKEGSNLTTAYDLYVSNITIPANKGITVVIAGANGYKEFSASATNITFAAADIISDTVTTTAQTIKVYIYFNGDDANVYTNNLAQLTGEVEFTLDAFVSDHQ